MLRWLEICWFCFFQFSLKAFRLLAPVCEDPLCVVRQALVLEALQFSFDLGAGILGNFQFFMRRVGSIEQRFRLERMFLHGRDSQFAKVFRVEICPIRVQVFSQKF